MRAVAVLTLLAASLNLFAANAADLPAILHSPVSPWPEWVAADLAVAEDGTLRPEMLGQFIPSLHRLARANAEAVARQEGGNGPCRIFRGSTTDHLTATATLEGLTTNAAAIVSGEVVALREGFFGGQPGTLLLLSARYLKGPVAAVPLLFYPYAQIETREGTLCSKPSGDFVPPRVGDRLLIFTIGEPRIEQGRTIFSVNVARQLVHESLRGTTRVPNALRLSTGEPATFDTVARAVAAAVERTSKAQ